jgi:tetratricopeptide (TPR) repeat protein
MLRSLILFTCLLLVQQAFSQATLTYQSADSITYTQFINKDCKALHHTAKQALRNDIDFYFLRMRLGISYYEKKNYEAALPHFNKANNMNPTDTLAQEYLYYSLLFTNRIEDAYDLAKTFSESLQKKIHFKHFNAKDIASTFQSVSISGGAGINTNITKNKSNVYPDTLYVENTLQGETYLGNISLQNKITNRLKVYNSISYFNVNSLGIIHSALNDTSTNYSNNSYQYNLGISYRFKNQFLVGGTFGYFKEKSNYFSTSLDTSNFRIKYYNNAFDHNAYSGTLYSYYRFGKFEFGLSTSIANLSDSMQYQGEATVAFYPLGNQNLYLVSSAAFLQNGSQQNFIFNQRIGAKISKWLWVEGHASYGNHQNYLPSNGYISYNTVEPIQFTAGTNLNFKIGKLNIIPAYTLQQKESTYMQRNSQQQTSFISNNYFNHLLTTTLKWNF